MICNLPDWAVNVLLWSGLIISVGTGLWAMDRIASVGKRRHPGMHREDSDHRRTWETGGFLLGFLGFIVILLVYLETARPIACELVGTYREPPDYSMPPPNFDDYRLP